MHGGPRRRKHVLMVDSATLSIRELASTGNPVSGDDQAIPGSGDFKQFLVSGPQETGF